MPVLECIRIIDTMCTGNRLYIIFALQFNLQKNDRSRSLKSTCNHTRGIRTPCAWHMCFPTFCLWVQTLFWNTKAVASRRIWFNHPRTRPCGIANLYNSNAMQILCASIPQFGRPKTQLCSSWTEVGASGKYCVPSQRVSCPQLCTSRRDWTCTLVSWSLDKVGLGMVYVGKENTVQSFQCSSMSLLAASIERHDTVLLKNNCSNNMLVRCGNCLCIHARNEKLENIQNPPSCDMHGI